MGWSVKTTQRTFKRAEQAGLLDVGNYNRRKYDRTHWYTINYDALQRLMKDGTGTADASPEQGSAPGDEGSGSSAAGAQIGDKPVPKSGPSRGQVVPHHEVKMVKPIPERTSLQDKPDEHSDQRHVSSLLERLAEEHRRSRAKLVEYGSSGLAGTDQWTEEQMRRVSLITKLTCEAAADVFGDVNLADTLEKVTRVADRVQLAGVDLHPMDACDILDRYRRAQSLSPIQP